MSSKINKLQDDINKELFVLANRDMAEVEKVGYSNYSYWNSTFKIFISKKVTIAIIFVLLGMLSISIIQPYLPNQKNPIEININKETGYQDKNQPPSSEYWLGTNAIGQDLWARIWSGTRTSLFIGIVVGLFEAFFGIIIGAIWGYIRGLDKYITEIYNVLNNIPNTIIMVLI